MDLPFYFNAQLVITALAVIQLLKQPDFLAQKGRLKEEVQARNHSVIFYPKFHCELNFIERFRCAAKYFVRENSQY